MKSIKKQLTIFSTLVLIICGLIPGLVRAVDPNPCDVNSATSSQDAIKLGVNCASGNTQSSADATTSLNTTVRNVVNVLSLFAGAVAIIMIMIGGFRYVTSGGKQESITSAKNSIMYAIVGLVIIALAQVIVQFVLANTTPSCVNHQWDSGPHIGDPC
jgi:lysylphosphatidylglycerol synthetase-like protein (DUF2156 family)